MLVSLDANDTVGANSLSVSAYDIFTLTVTATGTGTSSGTAALLVQGSDIGLTAGGEEYDAIALLPLNNAPVLDSSISPVFGSSNQLVYTVTAATGNGALRVNGVALAVNGTFSQSDMNTGLRRCASIRKPAVLPSAT